MTINIYYLKKIGYNIALFFLASFFLSVFLRFFVFSITTVEGISMEPTLKNDEVVISEKLSYSIHEPQRFDIVELAEPSGRFFLVKRIIGLPGETVVIKDGAVFLTSTTIDRLEKLDESSFLSPTVKTESFKPAKIYSLTIPKDHYFALGDNRAASKYDSRVIGPFYRSLILGKIIPE